MLRENLLLVITIMQVVSAVLFFVYLTLRGEADDYGEASGFVVPFLVSANAAFTGVMLANWLMFTVSGFAFLTIVGFLIMLAEIAALACRVRE